MPAERAEAFILSLHSREVNRIYVVCIRREDRKAKAAQVPVRGDKLRIRPASFANHHSQARQFFFSQTEPEQNHFIVALTFELSKVETMAVRERMVGQLGNVDEGIAKRVANGLGMPGTIVKAQTTSPARRDLPLSPALSILIKAKPALQGKVIGRLVADGASAATVAELKSRLTEACVSLKVVAPKIGERYPQMAGG